MKRCEAEPPTSSRAWNSIQFLELAYDDYIAARTLFLGNMLPQACALAATCVEKYFKAIVAIRGNRCEGHLTKRLFKSIENYQPRLYGDLNMDFLEFLSLAYELRYLDNKEAGFGIVINKYRSLAELDRTISLIDKGFDLKAGDKPIQTPFCRQVAAKSEPLLRENATLLGIPRNDYFRKTNHVFEIQVAPDGRIIKATYQTEGVRDDGSFLKKPDLPDPARPSKGKLSCG